jgi:hypothetical protein
VFNVARRPLLVPTQSTLNAAMVLTAFTLDVNTYRRTGIYSSAINQRVSQIVGCYKQALLARR